jgi:hypothetical protein
MNDEADDFEASPQGVGRGDPVVETIRSLAVPPPPERSAMAIAALAEIARTAAESGVGADTAGSPEPRRKAMLKTLLSGVLAKVLLASSVAIAAVGGVAATGNLPGPMQDGVAYIVEPIGLDVPSSDDSTTTTSLDVSSSSSSSSTATPRRRHRASRPWRSPRVP